MTQKLGKKATIGIMYGALAAQVLGVAGFAAVVPVTHDVAETTYNGMRVRITESHPFVGKQVGELPEGFPEGAFYRLPGRHMYVPWYYTVELETPKGEHIEFRDFQRDGVYDDSTKESDFFYIYRGEETRILDGDKEEVMVYSRGVLDDLLDSEGCDIPESDFLGQWIFATECY